MYFVYLQTIVAVEGLIMVSDHQFEVAYKGRTKERILTKGVDSLLCMTHELCTALHSLSHTLMQTDPKFLGDINSVYYC